mmetsp:Transcript_16473/g.42698  ORF Transcript_16473/g.42698 Transcript_16473/m.42698 type:complete len:107 (-) Transcript_16473:779-1099(-)
MLWDATLCGPALSAIYDGLAGGHVFNHLLRFDHWLEMLVPPGANAASSAHAGAPDTVQALFPGHVVEFNAECGDHVPTGARLVCFPRSPKPHEITLDWAAKAWHEL